ALADLVVAVYQDYRLAVPTPNAFLLIARLLRRHRQQSTRAGRLQTEPGSRYDQSARFIRALQSRLDSSATRRIGSGARALPTRDRDRWRRSGRALSTRPHCAGAESS